MTTITTRQAAYIEDLRSNLTPVDPATVAANVQYVLDYAVQRAHQMTRRAIRIDLRKNGPIQLEELKARTQEILNARLQQTDVRTLMENRITEWATDSERDYSDAISADLEKIDREEASRIIDFLTSPMGILARNADALPAEILLVGFPEQNFIF